MNGSADRRSGLAGRLLREPMLQFLLIGLALFAGYAFVSPDRGDDADIVITAATVAELERQYEARWNRPPDDAERSRLVEAHVRDEVLYREGVALGLDRDDPVIKRRVRQKLELVAEEALAAEPPTDAQLAAFMGEHPDRFRRPPRLSFEQVFFDASVPPARLDAAVTAARDALARGEDPSTIGAPSLLPHRVDRLAADLVARDFGVAFAERVRDLPVGAWAGPVRSGFGLHLVRVTAAEPAQLPELDAVRATVVREWEAARRARSSDDGYRQMRARYRVTVEPAPGAKAP